MTNEPRDFIREIVAQDQASGRYGGRIATRFPPEPNGYLHIGHAKSICLNFGIAAEQGGVCHLRFDDTNPETEDIEYVESIMKDVRWLGFDWGPHLYFASDYYAQLYQFAEELILQGKAYVDSLTDAEIKEYRGTITQPGRESPDRNRPIAENLDLFRRMRAGEFPDGTYVLRARGDMASANMKMRDPLLYRIRHAHHYRTGDDWCIYPMYDYAHPLSDAIERITHSICTLEFENNREIYDWAMDQLFEEPRPHQYEFARLALDYTLMSKRKLLQLVEEGLVIGWDDPRLPTIAGLRRRGVTPEAIRKFCDVIGVAKVNSRVEYDLLEHCIRDDLNYRAPRVMAVIRPLRVVITNYPEHQLEMLEAPNWPADVPNEGSRLIPFGREIYIEQNDFQLDPPKGFHRLSPGREVRLRYAYIIRCDEVITDSASGEVVELRCTYDPDSRASGRSVKGIIHWVEATHALPAEVRLYERLFTKPDPEDTAEGQSFKDFLNSASLEVLRNAWIEPSVAQNPADQRYQFERLGYFVQDAVDSRPDALIFNRIVALRDSWAKQAAASEPTTRPARTPAPQPASTPAGPTPASPPDRTAIAAAAPETIASVAPIIAQVLAANADKVAAYRSGKTGLLGFFVGQVMKSAGSTATPQLVSELLQHQLAES